MVAELLALLPGMNYQSVMDMDWNEFSFWHGKAVSVYKRIRGIT